MVFSHTSPFAVSVAVGFDMAMLLRGTEYEAHTETITISITMQLHVYKYGYLSLSIDGHRRRLAGYETASSKRDLIFRYFSLCTR